MEKLFEAIGTALGSMPPALAAVVIIALFGLALVYLWRRSGEEARRQRDVEEAARKTGTEARLDGLGDKIDGLHPKIEVLIEHIQEIRTDVAVLRDRRGR